MNWDEKDVIDEQVMGFNNVQFLAQSFDSIDIPILVLNEQRQLIFANKSYLKFLGINDLNLIIGKRPGETLNCVHVFKNKNQCGASADCKNCSFQNTILKSMMFNKKAASQSSVTRVIDGCEYPFNIYEQVVPISSKIGTFYLISFIDATDFVRKRSLERIFFHDIINTTGAIKGLLELLKDQVPDNVKSAVELIEGFFDQLIYEIQCQKQLSAAENNELVLNIADINSTEVINSLKNLYDVPEIFSNKVIKIDDNTIDVNFSSDVSLLKRVLGNMLKNALEATSKYDIITIGCNYTSDNNLKFWVHNNVYIDPNVQSKIFVRSFSTKDIERGIGTYSMKLLGEKYLKGSVNFTTSKANGTEFYIIIPI